MPGEADLRPPNRDTARPVAQTVTSRGERWWEPLTTKWGIVLVLVFFSLAFGVFEVMFKDGARDTGSTFRGGKRTSAEIGKQIMTLLPELPGQDHKKRIREAKSLLLDFRMADDEKEKARSQLSELGKRNADEQFSATYGTLVAKLDKLLRDDNVNNDAVILAALKEAVENWTVSHSASYINKYIERMEEEGKRADELAKSLRDLEQFLMNLQVPSDHVGRSDLRNKLWNDIETIDRLIETSPAGLSRTHSKEREAQLRNIHSLPYDQAVRLFIDSFDKTWAAPLQSAGSALRGMAATRGQSGK